jgi:hypothetical protein
MINSIKVLINDAHLGIFIALLAGFQLGNWQGAMKTGFIKQNLYFEKNHRSYGLD